MPINDSNATNDNDETIVELRGPSGNSSEVTPEGKQETVISYNDTVSQVRINPSDSAGQTVFVNLNNTELGNMVGRAGVRIWNRGGKVRWRIFGNLTGSIGEDIGKNEAFDFPWGDTVILEVREQNSNNEIDIVVTEYK